MAENKNILKTYLHINILNKYNSKILQPKIRSRNSKYIKKKSDVHHNCMTPGNDKDDIRMLGKIRECLVSDDKAYRQWQMATEFEILDHR